jgi:hypothetical protein
LLSLRALYGSITSSSWSLVGSDNGAVTLRIILGLYLGFG